MQKELRNLINLLKFARKKQNFYTRKRKNFIDFRNLMSSPKKIIILIIAVIFIACTSKIINDNSSGESFEAVVLRVIDGDTIEISRNFQKEKLRLYAIDAPESKQKFGDKATAYLRTLVENKKVKIILQKQNQGRDMYKRLLGTIELNGENINAKMVKEGFAWAYRSQGEYKSIEEEAKADKRGLWADKNPQDPYDWRKKHK